MRRRMMNSILDDEAMNRYEDIFIGNGTQEVTIPLDFEPDYIYVKRTNLLINVNATYGAVILKDMYAGATYTQAESTTLMNGGFAYGIDGLYGTTNIWATYSSGNLTLHLSPASRVPADGEEYKIICGKFA